MLKILSPNGLQRPRMKVVAQLPTSGLPLQFFLQRCAQSFQCGIFAPDASESKAKSEATAFVKCIAGYDGVC
jgi:hypothetical protein